MLNDELSVETGGKVQRRGKFAPVMHLGDAHRRAKVCGLDEEWVLQPAFDGRDRGRGIPPPFRAQQRQVRRLQQTGSGEEALHDVLIHAGGGSEDP